MKNMMIKILMLLCALSLLSNITNAKTDGIIERDGWSFDRSDLSWPKWSDPVSQQKEGKLNHSQGWVEYDIHVPESGWYSLWQTGVPSEWTRDILLDGQVIHRLHTATSEDKDPNDGNWIKDCNLYLTQGKHALQYRRYSFPGSLPHAWQLRPSGHDPAGRVQARTTGHQVIALGQSVGIELTSSCLSQTQYTLVLKNEMTQALTDGPILTFAPSKKPVIQHVQIKPDEKGIYQILARVGKVLLKPSDLGLGRLIVIDTKPVMNRYEMNETLVVDIDCVSSTTKNFFENSNPSVIINKPFGRYRQTTGADLNSHWGVQSFAYRVTLPDHDHVYKLVVDYPDDDRRTMGFWVNDGAKLSNSTGNTVTGGVETGDRYQNTNQMLQHEAIFYPREHENITIAVVNLTPGSTAAAARIRIYQIQDQLPAAHLGQTRGRKMGYYFEESGRWLKHFGGQSSSLDQQILTMERWARRNLMMGANLMMPTINVYQANHYPSDILLGYFNRTNDECRMAALIAQAYGSSFVPEFHLSGQVNFDRVVMGVWVENDQIHFRDQHAKDMVHVNRDGSLRGPWKPFVYNVLHPKVQETYISVFGELADRLADCESFAGISSRLMLSWQWQGWNALPGLTVGYSDWTIKQFEKETGVIVPDDDASMQRYKQRFQFLTGPKRELWNQWRCDKVFAFHQKLRDRIVLAKPDAQLFLPYHGVGQNTCLSDDPLDQLIEIGIDPQNYATEPGIVLAPNALYGRRRSTPLADSRKWEQAIGKLSGTLAKLGGRGFGFYSDYFEVNKHFDWTKLGARRYSAFDACTPSGLHERELYAIALAENDSSFLFNGGNGHIWGTPSVMLPFLREYRALPDIQFEPLPDSAGGRDPVAVWQKVHDQKQFFYMVNRLNTNVSVTLSFSGKPTVLTATDDKEVYLSDSAKLTVELPPYMLKAFYCSTDKIKVASCDASVSKAFKQQVSHVIQQIKPMRDRLYNRQMAVELNHQQAKRLIVNMDQAIGSATGGRYWRAWSNLFLPDMVHLYDLTGFYPDALFARQTPRGLHPSDQSPEVSLVNVIGDTRGHIRNPDALTHDTDGNLYVASDQQIMCFDVHGQYQRTLNLVADHDIPTGDISKYPRLEPPRYLSGFRMLWALPDDRLAVVKGWGPPSIYETTHGRLLEVKSSLPGRVYDHIAYDATGNMLVSITNPPNAYGLYRYPDGWAALSGALRLPLDQIAGLTTDRKGHIFISSHDHLLCYDTTGQQLFDQHIQDSEGISHLAVSPESNMIFTASRNSAVLKAYTIEFNQNKPKRIKESWSKKIAGRWINALAMIDESALTVGITGAADNLLVKQYTVDQISAKPTSLAIPSLSTLKPYYLRGITQLKAHGDAIYFLSDNQLCRLIPGDTDQIDVVYDPHVVRADIESFAFAPNGDLYLASNSGLFSHSRGTNVYRARKDGKRWLNPKMLNGNKPLVPNPYIVPTDLTVDQQGRLLIQHVNNDLKRRGPSLVISALKVDDIKIQSASIIKDMGPSFGWSAYGLYPTVDGGLLIAGGSTREIARLDSKGQTQFQTCYALHQGEGVLPLRDPQGITMDQKQRIWVADTGTNQILCFSCEGKLLGRYGHFGNMDHRDSLSMSKPMGIVSVEHEGRQWLYVADVNNQRLLKLEVK